MNEREKLIKEIEQAPDSLVEEVLGFLLFTKNIKKNIDRISNRDMEMQLRAMAEDLEIQSEINAINKDFLVTEMNGLK
ncbi:MAG: DUF2281 domain-containing protein [Xenococcaceae cyanobacterium]